MRRHAGGHDTLGTIQSFTERVDTNLRESSKAEGLSKRTGLLDAGTDAWDRRAIRCT